ncbi:superfamily I DNA/RNA helicase/RecB family exonuclease [Prauserella sediminis]|uniref:DNA 3'-5' helicase n=1 Tax=Prauserella sediminis TaxID=577680 RepID=A0A839XJ71_9PSEU|nr:ATP-dependent DNA helicase [Prauserella sediminis]MBB3661809.1 superfamily I DNA/RNA helicase/RecB family exonuclease [Prauserella sediminis]
MSRSGLNARLVRPSVPAVPAHVWEPEVARLFEAPAGFVRVVGGPGTGKTALTAELAAERIRGGADPESILVVTSSRRAANVVRRDITRRITAADTADDPDATGTNRTGTHRTVREPMVRTVHSYAFAVLRLQANLTGQPEPRLLSGPEQDVVVRELLAGDLERGAYDWPERLRPALGIAGFAEELRDLILRAAERGLGPEDLVKLGRSEGREEWVAAGNFWRQYEEVTLLHGSGGHAMGTPGAPAMDAAELVASALVELEGDPELLEREQHRLRHVLVDDAQHLDPLQLRLLRLLGGTADDFVLAGDPDQSVFSFRGADPTLLSGLDGAETVTLTRTHRPAPAVHDAVTRIARGFAGTGLARDTRIAEPDSDAEPGAVRARLFPTPAAEASWLADRLRRAHLLDEVPWEEMAVLVRSPTRSMPVLQRALAAAGVPIASAAEEVPLARQSGVRPLLEILRLATDPDALDADVAEMLLASPLGGADPLALRRLRRGLRRLELTGGGERSSDDLLVEVLRGGDILAGLADAEAAPVRRVGGLLATAREAAQSGMDVENVLWRVWQASGLEKRLLRQIERGGSLAAQADRDLDAVVALFDVAGRYVDRLPKASVGGFAEYLTSQHIAGDSLAPVAARGSGVSLLTAHAAAGREWTVVAVAGAQEGGWPDLRPRGTLLGVERLVDLLSGVDGDGVSVIAPLLAEERRLFYVAASRARSELLVTAVQGEDEQPSRFVEELLAHEDAADAGPDVRVYRRERALVLPELVGELRSVVCDDGETPDRQRRAATQLARLARAGVPGAHPSQWYGLHEPSTVEPLRKPGEPVRVSPSTVEVLAKCPLRWLIERHGGADPSQLAAVTGTLVHALAQAAASGADHAEITAELDKAWTKVDAGAPWFSRRERVRVEQMVQNFLNWLQQSRQDLTQLAVEQEMSVELPVTLDAAVGDGDADSDPDDPDDPDTDTADTDDADTAGVNAAGDDGADAQLRVTLTGRVDRLEVDGQGRPVVVDLKTGKNAVSAKDAEQHPQLAAYQLAVLLGAFEHHLRTTQAARNPQSAQAAAKPGGAKLVYVAKSHTKTGASERQQPPLDSDGEVHWLQLVRDAAAATAGPSYEARENQDCDRCPARSSCPARPEGRQVTGP